MLKSPLARLLARLPEMLLPLEEAAEMAGAAARPGVAVAATAKKRPMLWAWKASATISPPAPPALPLARTAEEGAGLGRRCSALGRTFAPAGGRGRAEGAEDDEDDEDDDDEDDDDEYDDDEDDDDEEEKAAAAAVCAEMRGSKRAPKGSIVENMGSKTLDSSATSRSAEKRSPLASPVPPARKRT